MYIIFSNYAIIIGQKQTSITNFVTFPQFIRFDDVEFWYWHGSQPIEEKCEFTERYLLSLQPVLHDSNTINICAQISMDPKDFNDHSHLLDYIRNHLLLLCNSSRAYKFFILNHSDENLFTHAITSILQINVIECCQHIEIVILDSCGKHQKSLPVEAISNWLEKSDDGIKVDDRLPKEKFLSIRLPFNEFQNTREILDYLMMVHFYVIS